MIHANSICQEFLAYKTAARIDIQIEITPVSFKDISKAQPGEPSAAIRERVVRARHIDADPAGYHPCSTADQVVHVGCIVPGDHEGAQRSCHPRQAGLPRGYEGERHLRSPHPCRNRLAPVGSHHRRFTRRVRPHGGQQEERHRLLRAACRCRVSL